MSPKEISFAYAIKDTNKRFYTANSLQNYEFATQKHIAAPQPKI